MRGGGCRKPGKPAHRAGWRGLPVDRPARRGHPRHPHRAGRCLVLQAQPQPDQREAGQRREHTEAKFAPVELVATRPNLALAGGAQFMDLAGDGQPDLVVLDGPMPGFYEHDGDEGWQPFRPFTSRLNRDMRDPNLKIRRSGWRRPRRRADHRRRRLCLARLAGRGGLRPGPPRRPGCWTKKKARAWFLPTARSPSIWPT